MSDYTRTHDGGEPDGEAAGYEPPRAEDVSAHDSIDTASMVVTAP